MHRFFDLGDNVKPEPSPNTPAWVTHIAFKVPSVKDVETMKARLEANGIKVLGVTDHGFVKSIYFFDPNGVRLEFTAETVERRGDEGLCAATRVRRSTRGPRKRPPTWAPGPRRRRRSAERVPTRSIMTSSTPRGIAFPSS